MLNLLQVEEHLKYARAHFTDPKTQREIDDEIEFVSYLAEALQADLNPEHRNFTLESTGARLLEICERRGINYEIEADKLAVFNELRGEEAKMRDYAADMGFFFAFAKNNSVYEGRLMVQTQHYITQIVFSKDKSPNIKIHDALLFVARRLSRSTSLDNVLNADDKQLVAHLKSRFARVLTPGENLRIHYGNGFMAEPTRIRVPGVRRTSKRSEED